MNNKHSTIKLKYFFLHIELAYSTKEKRNKLTKTTHTMYSTQPQRLALPAWYLVKQFAGIYGVKMNYQAVKKLHRDVISRAYFDVAKLPAITRTVTYNSRGQPEKLPTIKSKDWIKLILKRAAMGYNNRQFYESLANTLHPPKVRCPCGGFYSSVIGGENRHRSNKGHIKGMLALKNWDKSVCHYVPLLKEVIGGQPYRKNYKECPWLSIDISPYIGGKYSYDNIVNDLKAISGTPRNNGLAVYGPYDRSLVKCQRCPHYYNCKITFKTNVLHCGNN